MAHDEASQQHLGMNMSESAFKVLVLLYVNIVIYEGHLKTLK